ncbi:peptidase S9 [bacterium]|nr:peptidase S9 [bacterium]
MPRPARLLPLALLLLLPPALAAAAPPAPANEWSVEAIVAQEAAREFAVSPDGRWAAWAQRALVDAGKAYRWQLWLAPLDVASAAGEARQLTRAESDARRPRWSPDGRRLAFLAARAQPAGDAKTAADPEPQIWLLPLAGGEAEALTDHAGGIADFAWIGPERLLYLAGEGKSLRETRLEEQGDETVVVGDEENVPPARLFTLTLGEAPRRLTANGEPILDFVASPDGRHAVARYSLSLHDDYDARTPPAVRLVDLASGAVREILPAALRAHDFTWDLESKGFYFLQPVSTDSLSLYVSQDELAYRGLGDRDWRSLDLDWQRGLDAPALAAWRGGALVSLADGLRNRLLLLERKGETWAIHELPRPARGVDKPLATSPDGKLLLLAEQRADRPDRYLVWRLGGDGKAARTPPALGERREFLRLNSALGALPAPQSEPFRWRGAAGDSVEGLLIYPIGYEAGRDGPRPLVVMPHGGPADADRDRFDEDWYGSAALLAARGAFVLKPNYHGSSGYGLAWLESIKGRYYELELPDIRSGIDSLVARGLADGSRLALVGWSNGAILSIAAAIESEGRYRALVAGAGDVNWTSDYGNCAFGAAFDDAYFGGAPWELPELYLAKSPLFRLDRLQVPTLVAIGEADVNVPTEQGQQLYRALQQTGAAPVRFLRFPGEDHFLASPPARRRYLAETLAWLDRWLFELTPATEPRYRPESPLARALALADVATSQGYYGELAGEALVPELLPWGELLVGRFEVTRAQWAAFKGRPRPAERREGNLPVAGVSADEARAYCSWLGTQLGADCRLPNGEEWERLTALAAEPENTLAWWAGQAPGRDDAAALAETVAQLAVNRDLLEPVGSFAPAGSSGLYDLGGNAAEWVREGGRAVARGLCAATAPDALGGEPAPPAAYIGLRVVVTRAEE